MGLISANLHEILFTQNDSGKFLTVFLDSYKHIKKIYLTIALLWPDRFAMGDEGEITLVSYAAAYELKETEYAETCIRYISYD